MIPVRFAHPWVLLLILPIVPFIIHVSYRSLSDLTTGRLRVSTAIRIAIVILLLLSLAGAKSRREIETEAIVFLVDASDSVRGDPLTRGLDFIGEAAAGAERRHRLALVSFAGAPAVERPLSPALNPDYPEAVLDTSRTDIASAIRLARGLVPPGASGSIVLVSDGEADAEASLAAARELSDEGIRLDVYPIESVTGPDRRMEDIVTPERVRSGEAFRVTALVTSEEGGEGTVQILRDGNLIARRNVRLHPGEMTPISFRDRLAGKGLHTYRAVLIDSDSIPANNTASTFIEVEGEPSILVLEGRDGAGAMTARLLSDRGMNVETMSATNMPPGIAGLSGYDAIILSDVPAYDLGPRNMESIREALRTLGIGLVCLGGPDAYGPGGYFRTPLEEALPVSMELRSRLRRYGTAVVIVIDTSGSMAAGAGGRQKIDLADEGAARVAELLFPGDVIGVIGCDDRPSWAVPVTTLGSGDRSGITNAIRGIRAGGGGIFVYDGLAAAGEALRTDGSSVRHIIVFSDAADAEQQIGGSGERAEDLAARFQREGITTSVIGLGTDFDPDAAFLQRLGAAGAGRVHFTSDATTIPEIFTAEVMEIAQSAVVEEDFTPVPSVPHETIRGISWISAPPLAGYVQTTSKDLAEVPLLATDEAPLLAAWSFGLGRSVAFTSDIGGNWSKRWSSWGGLTPLASQMARWTLREARGDLDLHMETSDGEGRISVEALDQAGEYINLLELDATVVRPDFSRETVHLRQIGPGSYEGTFPASGEGSYIAAVTGTGGSGAALGGVTVPYSREYRPTGKGGELMEALARTGRGRVLSSPEEALRAGPAPGEATSDLWPILLAIACALLPLDVGVRRLAISGEELRRKFGERFSSEPVESSGTMSALREKRTASRPVKDEEAVSDEIAAVKEKATRIMESRRGGSPPGTARKDPSSSTMEALMKVKKGGGDKK